jgi:hypothetical protein
VRIEGKWVLCEDAINRPMVEVSLAGGAPFSELFLVDSGADKTVFCRQTLDALGLETLPTERIKAAGVGGATSLVALETAIEFAVAGGGTVRVTGPFSAQIDADVLDMNLLGRDVLNNFEVLVSYRRREVLLLAPPSGYQVTTS